MFNWRNYGTKQYFRVKIENSSLLDKINEAYLNFQQALKYNNNKKAVTRALFFMTRINILDKDFYTASYNLHKTDHLDIEREKLINIMLFSNAVN